MWGILVVLVVGVVLSGVVYVMGAMLPVEHHAVREATFRAGRERVFALIAGPQDWRVACEAVATRPGEARRWREGEGRRRILFEEVAREEPGMYGTRIADETLPFSWSWRFELMEVTEGTRVRITEDGAVRSPVFRFVSHYVMGETRTMDGYLRALGGKLGERAGEAGPS
ncbi:MAG TPA: hypothetical protein VHQ47_13770 [Phycisphaerae bacterium]|nr:hypothetical protein [Phycisphaerae bacterium]